MATPSSGPISIEDINDEFGLGNNLNAYRGVTWYTDAGSSGTFPSGAISMDDFYGKRSTVPTTSLTITSNQNNIGLRDWAIANGWNTTDKLVVTINSGVYISSNNATAVTGFPDIYGNPALTISGTFPNGVELINNGYIIGMGGAGGDGGGRDTAGEAGFPGGRALYVTRSVAITNNGTIAGGGGGGAGGTGVFSVVSGNSGGGGGGGGGRSSAVANSAKGLGNTYGVNGSDGTVGTVSAAGSGGAGGGDGGNGGNGGDWGQAGSTAEAVGGITPAVGGAAGYYIVGDIYVTWVATGTRLGSAY